MTGRQGRVVHLVGYPKGPLTPACFQVVKQRVSPPRPGKVLVRNTWTSVDPGLLLRMREDAPAGYFPAFPLGEALEGILTVGEVVESQHPSFTAGDTVWHARGWREYSEVAPEAEQLSGLGT